jgi:hypothetical protein
MRDQIAAEHDRLQQADRQLKRSGDTVRQELAGDPTLFPEWQGRLSGAQQKLTHAKADGAELDKAEKGPGNNEARQRAQRLLSEERDLRLGALRDSDAVEAEAAKWIDYKNNAPHYVAKVRDEYDAIHKTDLSKASAAVTQAEKDWPAKKADLDSRLDGLKKIVASTDAKPALDGMPVATLIQTDETLAAEQKQVTEGSDQIVAMTGQLYDSWDKILEDLDKRREGPDTVYREKVKTVRTHFADVAAKKTDVSSDVEWQDVPASSFQAVENDLGMAISHKDAGLYDSEATNVAQPPGFAYMATPEQGRNQYGYWDHTSAGSVWTWLPEYLIMRELFWGPRYVPVYVNEFNGYYTARNLGRPYYGTTTPAAPPKYGTHGSFTEQRYASSRYVQSGGFKGSAYSSGGPATAARPGPSAGGFSRGFGEGEGAGSSAGKRFGGGPSEGKRFGGAPPAGRRFGGGSAPRMAPRSFGGHR